VGKYIEQLDEQIQAIDKKNYYRGQYQSYMTGPEWRNVEMAQEYAAFLREGKSMFQFPYFRQVAGLWRVFYHSYKAARKYDSPWSILFSEYMLMDLFVCFFTTVELIPKALLSMVLNFFLGTVNRTEMQQHLAEHYQQYAQNLETIPFYDHQYKEIRENLENKYRECREKTWGDWFSWKVVATELWMRRWISKPLSYWFHQDANLVPATTEVLVKFKDDESSDQRQAKKTFRAKITQIQAQTPAVSITGEDVYVKENQNKSYLSVYARLTVPRYASFQTVVHELAEKDIHLRKIAGHDKVQVKCIIDAPDENNYLLRRSELEALKKGTSLLYTYGDNIHPWRKFCLFDVDVHNLDKSLGRFTKHDQEEVSVQFIHNF